MFYHRIDLEDYIECVYDGETAFFGDQFDPTDPVLQKQEQYLETIATEEWVDLVELYKEIKKNGLQSDSFEAFRHKLYKHKIIFPFRWYKWCQGKKGLQDTNTDFSNCSLLQLLMYLTLIFGADCFSEGTIQQCLANDVLDKLMKRVEEVLLDSNQGFQIS